MPTDDEDFYEGSGSGDDNFEESAEEGSGGYYINALSPEEVDNLRRSFYYEHEVDLLRVDTTCQEKFISAPQIFHAQIRLVNGTKDTVHEYKYNVSIPFSTQRIRPQGTK